MLGHGEAQNTEHGTKKTLGNFDTGCINATMCLEILQVFMYLLAATWLSEFKTTQSSQDTVRKSLHSRLKLLSSLMMLQL